MKWYLTPYVGKKIYVMEGRRVVCYVGNGKEWVKVK